MAPVVQEQSSEKKSLTCMPSEKKYPEAETGHAEKDLRRSEWDTSTQTVQHPPDVRPQG